MYILTIFTFLFGIPLYNFVTIVTVLINLDKYIKKKSKRKKKNNETSQSVKRWDKGKEEKKGRAKSIVSVRGGWRF